MLYDLGLFHIFRRLFVLVWENLISDNYNSRAFMKGKRQVTKGDTSFRFTDAYKIEIFGSNGDLVDTIPLTHFANSIDIFGDNLFFIDKYRGMQVYQYRIISNNKN